MDKSVDYCSTSSSSSSSNNNDHLLIPINPSTASASSPLSHSVNAILSPKRKAGRKKFRETRHPIYRGVRERNGGKWVCEVREPNKKTRIWLGTYPTPEMAARAHDVAAITLKGKFAKLNFEDSVWRLPLARSTNAKEIRKAAAEAAEMFRARKKKLPELIVEMPASTPMAYVDEEAVFNMPRLIEEMAAGLMLTPPGMQGGGNGWFDCDIFGGECCNEDINLWSY